MLCPGLKVTFEVEKGDEKFEWLYEGGLEQSAQVRVSPVRHRQETCAAAATRMRTEMPARAAHCPHPKSRQHRFRSNGLK